MKSIVLFSGGLDSTVLLKQKIDEFGVDEVAALSIHYGQRHEAELQHALRIAKHFGVRRDLLGLCDLNREDTWLGIFANSKSSQVNPQVAVPEGHYEAPSMRATFVPNRNAIMLSIAAAFAISEGAKEVCFAAHAGDHAIYPDCRHPFISALGIAIKVGNYEGAPVIDAPFIQSSKADIVALGHCIDAPLWETWSCYNDGEVHCGKCGTCVERREAFDFAGIADPTEYAL